MSMQNLGEALFTNRLSGRFLQAHSDNGEMHASNQSYSTEEIWNLIEIDKVNHIYALQNLSNGKYVSKKSGVCAPADNSNIGISEQWEFVSGSVYGLKNTFAIRSVADGKYLSSFGPGDNGECGGEVSAFDSNPPLSNIDHCSQWWVYTPLTAPKSLF